MKEDIKNTIKLAYSLWRFECWLDNIGSYDEIEYLVREKLLEPLEKPNKKTKKLIKSIIEERRNILGEEY